MDRIIHEVKSVLRGLPMAMVTLVVVVAAFKVAGALIEKAAPGKGEMLKNLIRA